MDSQLWMMVGIVAASLTSFGFVPQVRKMWVTKQVKDVSPATMFQLGIGNSLWLLYGVYRNDWVIIGANIIAISIFIVGLYLFYQYRVKDIKR